MKGKIYKITCEETNKIYYGSSTQKYLSRRLSTHKYRKSCQCKDFINPTIELVEEIEFEDKKELLRLEAYYIKNNECVNTQIPLRTLKEWAVDTNHYKKRYHKDIEKSREQGRENYEKHKEKRLEKMLEKKECELCGKLIAKCNMKRHQKNIHG